jgi:regulatory protein
VATKKLATEAEIYHAGIDFLSRRDYAAGELKQKLLSKIEPDDEDARALVSVVLERLESLGYQSDERYIEMLVRARKERGYGPQYIRQYLQQYRLESSLVEAYVDSRSFEWKEYAYRQLEKKFHQPSRELKVRQKQQRHLYQRGFDSDQIRWAMDRLDELSEE